MGLRDRFFTPKTARAIMSWRILLGVGVGAAMAVAGLPIGVAIGLGVALYAASVGAAMPKRPQPPSIDPFVLSEPWRRLMQQADGSRRRLRATVSALDPGPLQDSLTTIADQLQHGLEEAWEVAKRGDEIDDTVRQLDPTALRSKLATLQREATEAPSPDIDAAIDSVERQLATADRLKEQSAETATSLRLTQTQLDELVAKAGEVSHGAIDTESYRREVDEVVIRLEALHQAVEETRSA